MALEHCDAKVRLGAGRHGPGPVNLDCRARMPHDAAILAGPLALEHEQASPDPTPPIPFWRGGQDHGGTARRADLAEVGVAAGIAGHGLAVPAVHEAEPVVGKVHVLRIGRAVEAVQAAAGRHEIATREEIVFEDKPVAAGDTVPTPAAVDQRIAADASAADPAEEQGAAAAVKVAIGDLDVRTAQPYRIAAAGGKLLSFTKSRVHLFDRRVAAERVGADPHAPQEYVASPGLVPQVAGDHVTIVLRIDRQFLDTERVRTAQEHVGRLGQISPGQAGPLPVLAVQDGPTRNLERAGKPVSARREEDLPAAVLAGLLQGGSHGLRIVLDAVALRPAISDIEDRLGPGSRHDHAQRQRLAPGCGAAQSAVETDFVLTRQKFLGQR